MDSVAAHRIVRVSPRLKTLVVTGPRRGDWGFFITVAERPRGRHHRRFVPWQDYKT